MKNQILVLFAILYSGISVYAQFAPAAGQNGSTAIHADSPNFVLWSESCTISRGPIDISLPNPEAASYGLETDATGKADNLVVSLGDGGEAILTFAQPITNGEGFDFAVFENAFADFFLELAFVEVSSDGIHYTRFPAISNTPVDTQTGSFDQLDPTLIHNLAGKYRAMFGTPFDLDELAGTPDLDIDRITHIKVIDVVGSVDPNYASIDIQGQMVNDPWPTAFASGGFDLDAVGVINVFGSSILPVEENIAIRLFPQPCREIINLGISSFANETGNIKIMDLKGSTYHQETLQFSPIGSGDIRLPTIGPGVYLLHIESEKNMFSKKMIIY